MLSRRTAACLAIGCLIYRLERQRGSRRLIAELRDDLAWLINSTPTTSNRRPRRCQ